LTERQGAAGAARSGPERRRATALYADLTGSTALSETRDPEELYRIVGGCLKILETVAARHGSALIKSRGDGVLAVFGLPSAMEAPARAAVNAAIEMRARVAEYTRELALDPPLQLHTGVNTGLMVSGDVSTADQPEVDVVGDAVNVAARLSDMAPPGSIYVGEESYRATAGEFRFGPPLRLKLKGKAKSVSAHEVLSARSTLHRTSAGTLARAATGLVGRERELAILESEIGRLGEGGGGVAWLVGEAGLGKSRLVAELRATARARGIGWAEGRSLLIGRNLRFHPFADLLRSWWKIPESLPNEEAEERLEARLRDVVGKRADEIFPFVASLMAITVSEQRAGGARDVQGEALERLTRMAIRLVLEGAGRAGPLVAVFEDLHWADLASVELLEALVPSTERSPILFLCVSRPDEASAADLLRRALSDRQALTELRLPALGAKDCESLVSELAPGGAFSRTLRRRIVEKSGGNPFFVEEVVRSLEESSLASPFGGRLSAEQLDAAPIPERLEDVVLTRVDRLEAARRSLLQVASVIGQGFAFPILAEVMEEKDALEAEIEALVDAGFLVYARPDDDRGLAFRHSVIREVVYESLLLARRAELHRAVAGAIESHLTRSSPGYLGLLAYHCTLGEDVERAEEFVFEAGEEAASAGATSEALHFFQEAYRVFLAKYGAKGDAEERALLEKKIGLAFFHRGEFGPAIDHFHRWLELLGEPIRAGRVRSGARLGANLAVIVRTALLGLGSRPAATERQREIIALMFARARAQTTASPDRFLADTLENFRRLEQVDARTVPGSGGMIASGGTGIFGFSGLSFRLSQRLLDLAAPLVDEGDPRELFLFRTMSYYHHCFAGDWDAGHEIDEGLMESALGLGELWDVVTYLGVDARKKLQQGRFAEAEAGISKLVRIEELYAYDGARSTWQSQVALLHLERGELGPALDATDLYHRETDEELLNLIALGLKVKIHCLRDELDDARRELAKARDLMRRAFLLPPHYASTVERSQLLLHAVELEKALGEGQPGPARRTALRSARRAGRFFDRVAWDRVEIARLVGRVHWLCGHERAALRWWERSIAAGQILGGRPELARTFSEVGRRLQGASAGPDRLAGHTASELLALGARLASELGIEPDAGALRPTEPSAPV
jgi:class 3 adenylate cyclase/tetratricopeptide (TPR) repeat protein